MSNFNLHINDYNINELKDLLNLVDPYTLEDIVNNENEFSHRSPIIWNSLNFMHQKMNYFNQ